MTPTSDGSGRPTGGELVVRTARHVQAAPASVALLLTCTSVLELWPGAVVQDSGSPLQVSVAGRSGTDDLTLRVEPPRRARRSYEAAAHWTAAVAAPGSVVLRMSPQGQQGTRLRLDLCCAVGLERQLRPAADVFLAGLAHVAEGRALAG